VRSREDRLRLGQVFDGVAEDYDAVRPGYPPDLVDAALARGALEAGAHVLEIGAGTGKLTELLAMRGLEVDAVDPGPNMLAAARRRVADDARVRFLLGRFEEVDLVPGAYDAVFSATAFHWVDPAVGWRKTASLLRPDGLLALLSHRFLPDEGSSGADAEFRELLRRYVPDAVDEIPPRQSLEELLSRAHEVRDNASAVWDRLMSSKHGLALADAADLFTDVEVEARVEEGEQTADELRAHFRTTSLWFRIDPDRRVAFEREDRALIERHGGTIRFSMAAVLMTARRSGLGA